jgi:ATP-binding cassette subfamily F protein 3
LSIEDKKLKVYAGNYSYFREKKEAIIASKPDFSFPKTKKTADDSYRRFRQHSQEKGKIKKELRSIRVQIAEHEKKALLLEKELAGNIPKSDWEKLDSVSKEKSGIEDYLLELYNKLEELEKLDDQHSDSKRQPN